MCSYLQSLTISHRILVCFCLRVWKSIRSLAPPPDPPPNTHTNTHSPENEKLAGLGILSFSGSEYPSPRRMYRELVCGDYILYPQFGCWFIYKNTNSPCYFMHRHLNDACYKKAHSLTGKPYLAILASHVFALDWIRYFIRDTPFAYK